MNGEVQDQMEMSPTYCQKYEPSYLCRCTGTECPVTTGQTPHAPKALPTGYPKGCTETPKTSENNII